MEDVINIVFIIASLVVGYWLGCKLSSIGSFAFLSDRKGRFGAIDGLRGYLALSVFFCHFMVTWYWKTTGNWERPPHIYFENLGRVGIAIFFMITGYLFISKLLLDKGNTNWLKLFQSRVFRIMPLYLFALAVISLIAFYKTGFELNVEPLTLIKQYVRWFLFYGKEVNDYPDTRQIIAGVDWTLKYEWFFYLALPLTALFIKAGRVACIVLISMLVAAFIFPQKVIGFSSDYFIFFAIGGIAAHLSFRKIVRSELIKGRAVSIISIFAITLSIFYSNIFSALHIILISIFFIPVALGNDMFGLLGRRSSIFLGEISYSIYLLHGLVLYIAFTLFDFVDLNTISMNEYLWFMPVLAVLVILLSAVTYLSIERPSMRYGKKSFSIKDNNKIV